MAHKTMGKWPNSYIIHQVMISGVKRVRKDPVTLDWKVALTNSGT